MLAPGRLPHAGSAPGPGGDCAIACSSRPAPRTASHRGCSSSATAQDLPCRIHQRRQLVQSLAAASSGATAATAGRQLLQPEQPAAEAQQPPQERQRRGRLLAGQEQEQHPTGSQWHAAQGDAEDDSSGQPSSSGRPEAAPSDGAALTAAISRARSFDQLSAIVAAQGTQLSHIHVSAAFVRLQRLWVGASSRGAGEAAAAAGRPLLLQLQGLAAGLARVDSRYVANVAHALAVLERVEPAAYSEALVEQLCGAAHDLANAMPPQELATLMWALASLDVLPAQQLLRRLVANCLRKLGAFGPQDLAMVLGALPALQPGGRPPPHSPTRKLADAARRALARASPLEVSLLLSGVAGCGYRPSAEWLDDLWAATAPKLGSMGAAELGMAGLALGRMSPLASQPHQQWLDGWEAAVMRACLRPQQDHHQQQQQQQQLGASAGDGGRRLAQVAPCLQLPELAMALYGWSKAAPGSPPSAAMQQELFAATQRAIGIADGVGSSLTLQQQRQQLQQGWAQQPRQQVPPQAAALLGSLHQQRPPAAPPYPQQQQHPYSGRDHGGASPQLLVELLAAAARWQQRPPRPWLRAALGQLQQQLVAGACSVRDVSMLLWALAALGVKPSAAWMATATHELQQQLAQQARSSGERQALLAGPDAPPQAVELRQLGVAVWALRRLQHQPPDGFWAALWPCSGLLLEQRAFALRHVAQLMEEAAALQRAPPPEWSDKALAAALGMASSAAAAARRTEAEAAPAAALPNALDLLRIASSAARMGVVPGHSWCRGMLDVLSPAAEQLELQAVARLVWCLGKLGYRPPGGSLAGWLALRLSGPGRWPLAAYRHAELRLLLAGLRQCRAVLGGSWLLELLDHTEATAEQLPLEVLVELLLYASAARLRPPSSWKAAVADALCAALQGQEQQQQQGQQQQQQQGQQQQGQHNQQCKLPATAVLVAMVRLRVAPSAPLMLQLQRCAAVEAAQMGPEEAKGQQRLVERLQSIGAALSGDSEGRVAGQRPRVPLPGVNAPLNGQAGGAPGPQGRRQQQQATATAGPQASGWGSQAPHRRRQHQHQQEQPAGLNGAQPEVDVPAAHISRGGSLLPKPPDGGAGGRGALWGGTVWGGAGAGAGAGAALPPRGLQPCAAAASLLDGSQQPAAVDQWREPH